MFKNPVTYTHTYVPTKTDIRSDRHGGGRKGMNGRVREVEEGRKREYSRRRREEGKGGE